jgi:hypothetical protein
VLNSPLLNFAKFRKPNYVSSFCSLEIYPMAFEQTHGWYPLSQQKHLPHSQLFQLRMRHGEEMEVGREEIRKVALDLGLVILQFLLQCLAKHRKSVRFVTTKHFSTTTCSLILLLPR